MAYRDHTKVIKIGDRVIGGGNPILIQSMTNTRTEDVAATVAQIHALENAGCEIIRCTVPNAEAAAAIAQIKKEIRTRSVSIPAISAGKTASPKLSAAHRRGRSRSGSASTAAPWRRIWWRSTEA